VNDYNLLLHKHLNLKLRISLQEQLTKVTNDNLSSKSDYADDDDGYCGELDDTLWFILLSWLENIVGQMMMMMI